MLKRIINLGAVYYTVISGSFLVFAQIFGRENKGLDPKRFLFLLLFSFIMSTGTAIKESDIMGRIPRAICHAVCYIGGFFFCLILPYNKNFSFSVIATVIFAIFYATACFIKSVITKSISRKKFNSDTKKTQKVKNNKKIKKSSETQTEYKSLFSDNR